MRTCLRETVYLACAVAAVWAVLTAGGTSGESEEDAVPELALLQTPLTADNARRCFDEMRELSERDGGALWGVRLDAPMIFVDPKTRRVVADRADAEARLRPEGDVYVGELPEHVPIAGTVTTWAGRRWVMLPWPLPLERAERLHMMAHESFHYAQPKLDFFRPSASNAHLDTRNGRVWLRLEMRALKRALTCDGEKRKTAIRDALLFRAKRRALFPEHVADEREQEMLEGTAEYTGMRLAYGDAAVRRALKNFEFARGWPTFVHSFAYVTGAVYGLMLDEARPDWREHYRPGGDLGEMLGDALGIEPPNDVEAAALARAREYDYEELAARETEREENRRAFEADCRRRFEEGPVLTISIVDMQFRFDPRDVRIMPGRGRVYPKMKMTDAWGTIEVDGGALVAEDWTHVIVPAPTDPQARPLRGDGWRLDLSPGWRVRAGERKGDYRLEAAGGW